MFLRDKSIMELDPYMLQMLELFPKGCQRTIINTLMALKKIMNNMKHYIGDFKGEMKLQK